MAYSIHLLRHLRSVIGANIHRNRVARKMPLKKLAALAEVPETRLDHYELGKNEIDLNDLFRISCALETDIARLMGD